MRKHQPKPLPSVDVLNSSFYLNVETGALTWKYRPDCCRLTNTMCVGKIAGTVSPDGRVQIRLKTGIFRAHRIIFKMVHGYDPDEVDHIDGDQSNNRPVNLRDVSTSDNQKNMKLRRDNALQVKGVCFDKSRKKFAAEIQANGRRERLGRFHTLEEAEAAYLAAAARLHGEFARAV